MQSVAEDAQLPPAGAPEIAFAGRSNSGKSSAINALAGRTRLAFASRTPGRTQQINYFRLRSGALVADLPGYGYAAVPRALKRHWQAFLGRYVAMRQSLVGLVLIIDARHGLAPPDVTLLSGYLASGRPALVLATKIDKLAAIAANGGGRGDCRCARRRLSCACRAARRRALLGNAPHWHRGGGNPARRMAGAVRAHDRRKASAQRKGPAIKGSAAGPETPVAGIIHREGTRSGRKAGDVAVRFDRPLTPVRVPRRNQT